MTLEQAIHIIKADVVVAPQQGEGARELSGGFAADLMSDVLAFARERSLLMTGLTTDQTIRTASIKRLAAVLIVEGKTIPGEMLEAAQEQSVPVYRTPMSKFEACGRLMQAGLAPYRVTVQR